MSHRFEFSIQPGFYLYLSVMLLLFPFKWLCAALLAAAVHEAAHYIALRLFNVPVRSFILHGSGALLRTDFMKPWQEIVCASAGPFASALLLFMFPVFPELALCGLFHGVFNLIPVGGLDGARILRVACELLLGKKRGECFYKHISCGIIGLILVGSLILFRFTVLVAVQVMIILLLASKTKDNFLTNSLPVIN